MENVKNAGNLQRIKSFLDPIFLGHDLSLDEDIFSLGIVDSLFAMQVVLFVEKEFDIQLDGKDIDLENLRTINAISGLVSRKLNGA